MAMRMPRFQKQATLVVENHDIAVQPRTLGTHAPIIPFPGLFDQSQNPEATATVPARVQVRTRRLREHRRAEEDRFEASFDVAQATPAELLRALTAMLEEMTELRRAATATEPLILDIHLVAG